MKQSTNLKIQMLKLQILAMTADISKISEQDDMQNHKSTLNGANWGLKDAMDNLYKAQKEAGVNPPNISEELRKQEAMRDFRI